MTVPAFNTRAVPKSIKAVRILLWVQVVLAAIGIVIFAVLFEEFTDSHRGEAADAALRSALIITLVLSTLSAAVLAACAVLLTKRWKWVFYLTIAMEGVFIVDKLITMASGGFNIQLLIGIILAIAVLSRISTYESREYLLRYGE